MDFPSIPAEGMARSSPEQLNLLDNDNLLLDLDDKTLQCLVGSNLVVPSLGSMREGHGQGEGSGLNKRARDDERDDAAFHAWLFDTFPLQGNETTGGDERKDRTVAACGGGSAEGGSSDQANAEEGTNVAGGRKGCKRRAVNDAAVAKANRERARREKLNEYLDELSKLCDPAGKGFKADRVSVVADAIRVVQQLRVENNQLKQLNKFLEERVGHYEHARAQNMFQHVALASVNQPPPQGQGQPPLQGQEDGSGTEMAMQRVLVPVGSFGNYFSPQPGGGMGGMGKPEQYAAAAAMQAGVAPPPVSWLPAPNAHEDEKLRPPAA